MLRLGVVLLVIIVFSWCGFFFHPKMVVLVFFFSEIIIIVLSWCGALSHKKTLLHKYMFSVHTKVLRPLGKIIGHALKFLH
jgi:hypothetical protein